ncbi:MAG: HNH endonuclease [Sedimentisphaerales bacterium]
MGMPSRQRVLDFWREWLEEDEVDLLEPQCWCCYRPLRKSPSFKRLAKIDNPTWKEIRSAWNDCKELVRCHIIPDSLGGMPEPENIFLMCKRCHDEAPDTTSKEMFLRWVSSQYDVNRLIEKFGEFKKALRDFGVDSDKDIVELDELVSNKEFKSWIRKNVGIHVGPYGGTIKMSTIVAALLEYRNQLNHQNANQSAQEQLRLPFDDL